MALSFNYFILLSFSFSFHSFFSSPFLANNSGYYIYIKLDRHLHLSPDRHLRRRQPSKPDLFNPLCRTPGLAYAQRRRSRSILIGPDADEFFPSPIDSAQRRVPSTQPDSVTDHPHRRSTQPVAQSTRLPQISTRPKKKEKKINPFLAKQHEKFREKKNFIEAKEDHPIGIE